MFWNKKAIENPLGVPLSDLREILKHSGVDVLQEKGGSLVIDHGAYKTHVGVVEPIERSSPNGVVSSVVQIKTVLPPQIQSLFPTDGLLLAGNKMASLSALTRSSAGAIIGSRLTIYENEDAWRTLHLPLLLFATLLGSNAILGGLRRVFAKEEPREDPSDWTESDLNFVHGYLSRISVATNGGLGVTAEIPLAANAVAAINGDNDTALLQLMADQPHPELGGGLFVLLQMPHRTRDERKLNAICTRLNELELEARDLPPFFGAWCEGKLGGNPAYVSFIPNQLHSVNGIGLNFAMWAFARAEWANGIINAMGARA